LAPAAAQKRLKFVHLAWIALGLTAAVSGGLGGAPGKSLAGAFAMALVPGLAGYLVAGAGDTLRRGWSVIAWLLLAFVSVMLTGGGGSPLIVLLVVAPLTALLSGAPRMATEAGIFAALGLFAVFIAAPLGFLPPEVPGADLLAGPFALAGLVLAALIVSLLVADRQEAAPPAPPAETKPKAEPGPISLPGISWVDVTPEGRLRAVQGDTFGLLTLRAGSALASLFADPDLDPAALARPGRRLVSAELVSGQRVRLLAQRHARGWYILMIDAAEDGTDVPARAVAELEARLQSRTAFFASLGHELKTPLNAILGYAEVMQAELMGPMPRPYADYPAIIHESGTDLLLLVDDILDLARAEAGKPRLEPEPVDLTASAESVIRQLSAQASRAGVTLKLKAAGEVWAEADARAVRQIWQNLISNAIKYSPRGKAVTLETRIDAGAAVLSVTDRGAGIAPADLDRLTEPFAQGAGAKPGTGLGLSVVRSFAELHGGALHIASRPGKGTRVQVTLPRASQADIAPMQAAGQ